MSFRAGIQAGKAFISLALADKQFRADLHAAAGVMRNFGAQVSKIGARMALFGGAGLVTFLPFINTVAQAETSIRRFDLIFGKMAGNMRERLREISRDTGLGMTTLQEQAAIFGAIFAEMRDSMSEESFLDVVKTAEQETVNLAAMAGIGLEEAAERMKSGLTSTGEALDQFGYNLRKAAMEAEAERVGLKKSILTMTEMEKQLLKLNIMRRQSRRTGISFARMVNTINGQLTLLMSNIRELVVSAGWFFKMVLVPLLRALNMLLVVLRPVAKLLSPLLVLLSAGFAGVLGLGIAIYLLGKFITTMGIAISMMLIFNKLWKTTMLALLWPLRGWVHLAKKRDVWWHLQQVFAKMATVIPYVSRAFGFLAANIAKVVSVLGLLIVYWRSIEDIFAYLKSLWAFANPIAGAAVKFVKKNKDYVGAGMQGVWAAAKPTFTREDWMNKYGGMLPEGVRKYVRAGLMLPPEGEGKSAGVAESIQGIEARAAGYGVNVPQQLAYSTTGNAVVDSIGDLEKLWQSMKDDKTAALRTVNQG